MVLRGIARLAHLRGHAVDMDLADHGLAGRNGELVGALGNKGLVRQGQAQEARDLARRRHPLQEALVSRRRLVFHRLERQLREVRAPGRNLAIANLLNRPLFALTQAQLHQLAQVGLFVAHHDVVGAEVTNHAADAAECRRGHDVRGEHVEQLVFGVGPPRPVAVLCAEARALDERAGIELDLVGLKGAAAHAGLVIEPIGLGRGAQQVEHHVRMDLEAKQAHQRERPLDLPHGDAALIGVENALVEALDAHLDLSGAQPPDGRERDRRDGVGPGFDNQAHHTVTRLLVDALLALELLEGRRLELGGAPPRRGRPVQNVHAAVVGARGGTVGYVHHVLIRSDALGEPLGGICDAQLAIERPALAHRRRKRLVVRSGKQALGILTRSVAALRQHGVRGRLGDRAVVERTEELAHEPHLVALRVIAPRAAQDDELDLVDRVAHLRERREACAHLQIRVEAVLLRTGARRLGMQVAFGHAQVVGAKQAVARAGPGLGDDSDGRHARGGASRLHAQNLQQLALQLRRHAPTLPAGRFLALYALVERQQAALGQRPLVGALAAGLGMDEAHEGAVIHVLAGTQAVQYLQDDVFHRWHCNRPHGRLGSRGGRQDCL